jgi:hypothetical protein
MVNYNKFKRKRKRKWFGLYEWYSICSSHYSYNDNCTLCNAGSWIFRPFNFIEELFFKYFPKQWEKWKNKPKRRAAFLNKVKQWFPNLK